jgi:hypothetical protein
VHGQVTADQARTEAERRRGEVADKRDPLAEKQQKKAETGSSVNAVLDAFLERHVRKNLRSAGEVERVFDVYVRPRIGTKPIYGLLRHDLVKMLDAIEDDNGPVMADRVLAHIRKAFNWHTSNSCRGLRPVASLASDANQRAAAIKANPPTNQLTVLKCRSSGTSLRIGAVIRLSERESAANGPTMSRWVRMP